MSPAKGIPTVTMGIQSFMTASYHDPRPGGTLRRRHIVDFEPSGEEWAEHGAALTERLSADLTQRFGRGFGAVNLSQMKRFYRVWSPERILQTPSEISSAPIGRPIDPAILQTLSGELTQSPGQPNPQLVPAELSLI